MIDPSLMPELPDAMLNLRFSYDSVQMKAYGLQCYQLAMERAAQEVESWRGGKLLLNAGEMTAQELRTVRAVGGGIAAAIRALALQEKTNG